MNIPIWPGSSSFDPKDQPTPYGYYDDDYDFQQSADKFARFAAQNLGYPIVDVELQDINFYNALERSVTVYGNEVFAFKIRDNQLSIEGGDAQVDLSNSVVTPSMAGTIRVAKQYGAEAGSGGNITYHTGSIVMDPNKQDYDLNAWAKSKGLDKKGGIEVKRVFYESPPAITQYYDPYSGTGFGFEAMFNSFGFASMSPATNYLMMPLSFDLQTIQAIEMNETVRRSNYSFELINNRLKIFPIPTKRALLRFEYIINNERMAVAEGEVGDVVANKVTSVADSPYRNPIFSRINSVGREWIQEYALALVKQVLGNIRGKYANLPIPGAEITLNGSELITQGTSEKEALILRLREYLDSTSRQSLLERRALEGQFVQDELSQVPYTIYIA
tara:strand:- start:958 stop:2121 length:1164 start_codon:yes stop_codon:yes gene_type:complete